MSKEMVMKKKFNKYLYEVIVDLYYMMVVFSEWLPLCFVSVSQI